MIDKTLTFQGISAAELYEVLMDSTKHSSLTAAKAVIDPQVGGHFSTFDGYATGQNLQLIPGKLIEQTWHADDWPKDVLSTVKYELQDVPGGVKVHFTHSGIPEGREDEYEQGWQDYYWEPLSILDL